MNFGIYFETLQIRVFEECQSKLCEICHGLIIKPDKFYGNVHSRCYNRKSLLKKCTTLDITIDFFRDVFEFLGPMTEKFWFPKYKFDLLKFMYNNLDISNLKNFVYLCKYFPIMRQLMMEEQKLEWCRTLIRIYYDNPNITNKDIINQISELNYRQIPISIFKERIKKINDSENTILWKFWELNQEEYDNYIQFLPEELIVDISELENKPGGRFSYSLY